jgi:hypothetical protein
VNIRAIRGKNTMKEETTNVTNGNTNRKDSKDSFVIIRAIRGKIPVRVVRGKIIEDNHA